MMPFLADLKGWNYPEERKTLNILRGAKLNYKSVAKEISKPPFLAPEVFKSFYSLLKIYNFRNIVHFLKRMLQVIDNAVFWQTVLLYFENDPFSPSL